MNADNSGVCLVLVGAILALVSAYVALTLTTTPHYNGFVGGLVFAPGGIWRIAGKVTLQAGGEVPARFPRLGVKVTL